MAAPRILAVIPARYASTRFPGKPLASIRDKPMIQHVWERVNQTEGVDRVIIATDDPRIERVARSFGAEARMTSPDHPSGTDRVWEVAEALPEFDWVLNVQGDEPFINPAHLAMAIQGIVRHPDADVLTLVTPITDAVAWHDPNLVKALLTDEGRALYFSRSPIPYNRDCPDRPERAFRHIGIYLYRRDALQRFTQLPPSALEMTEKLEQLRALAAGMIFYGVVVDAAPIGVDTPDDLVRILDSVP